MTNISYPISVPIGSLAGPANAFTPNPSDSFELKADSFVSNVTVDAHKFPEVGGEPFNLSDEELCEAWGVVPDNQAPEEITSKLFRSIVEPSFTLRSEVWLKHHTGNSLRIDYVGFDRTRKIDGPIGFEIKRAGISTDDFSSFSNSLRQAQDYADCVISDSRATVWRGHSLRYVFMFPCPYQIYEADNRKWRTSYRDLWAQGALKIASQSGVGAMGYVPRKRDWGMFLGGHPAWWMKSGPTHLMLSHKRAEKIGGDR